MMLYSASQALQALSTAFAPHRHARMKFEKLCLTDSVLRVEFKVLPRQSSPGSGSEVDTTISLPSSGPVEAAASVLLLHGAQQPPLLPFQRESGPAVFLCSRVTHG